VSLLPFAVTADTVEPAAKDNGGADSAYEYMELLTQAMLRVRKHYIEEKDYKEIVYGALHGMLDNLDPHSAFLDPEAYSDIQDSTTGTFGGIGITVGMRDGMLTVIAPIEDSPGYRAGLQSGDRILAIDGKKTRNMTQEDAVKRMRGEKGTEVILTVSGDSTEGPRDVTIVREHIKVPSVKGARILSDGVAYVRITQFSEPTAGLLREKIEELLEQGMRALVLDLRSNPGGLLSSAVEVVQLFVDRGKLIVSRKGRPGVYPAVESKAKGDHHYTDFPMAVLVNGGSASAAEIVAGALQDHQRAVLVGSTTFGKASVQSVIRLRPYGKCAIRLTTAHYYTPNGREIHEVGIEPNIPVYVSGGEWRDVQVRRAHIESPKAYGAEEKAEYEDVVDRQLVRAVDLLKALTILQSAKK